MSEDVTQSADTTAQSDVVEKKQEVTQESKLVLENKKYRQRAQELEKKLQLAENEKLAEQGKWKELADQKTKALQEYEQKLKESNTKYAYKVVTSQIVAEASRLGCVDPEALIQLAPVHELEVDEEFNVNTQSVKTLLDNMQKTKPYLFQKQAPQVKDGVPSSKVEKGVDWKKLSIKEKAMLAIQKTKQT